jgi:hypothetical protein
MSRRSRANPPQRHQPPSTESSAKLARVKPVKRPAERPVDAQGIFTEVKGWPPKGAAFDAARAEPLAERFENIPMNA